MSPLNFANRAQRSAGLTLSAQEYLHLGMVSGVALHCAAGMHGVTVTGVNGPTEPDPAEFERLVIAARPVYEALGREEVVDPAPVRALAHWAAAHGSDPVRFLARLAAQMEWRWGTGILMR